MYTGIFVFSRSPFLSMCLWPYIKKRLKIDVRFHTIPQILSRIISEQTQLNKQINE